MAGSTSGDAKSGITLFTFYVLGIEQLLDRSPWELETAVSPYHEQFLEEQRLLGLTTLLMLGERQVSVDTALDKKFRAQARASVNRAVFQRALQQFFATKRWDEKQVPLVIKQMQSYIDGWRGAIADKGDVRVPLARTIIARVPPQDKAGQARYAARVSKIVRYVAGYVGKVLLQRYDVSS